MGGFRSGGEEGGRRRSMGEGGGVRGRMGRCSENEDEDENKQYSCFCATTKGYEDTFDVMHLFTLDGTFRI